MRLGGLANMQSAHQHGHDHQQMQRPTHGVPLPCREAQR
jgi:hypothetical protein